MMHPVTECEERFGRAEVLFREVNERVEGVRKGQGLAGRFDFLCECGDKSCIEEVSITLIEYEGVRSDSTQFVVLPGHELLEIESIVQEGDRFSVVRKHEETAPIAEWTDPRS
jgi:hypothetical protein